MNTWKKIHHADSKHKKTGLAILISDKIEIKTNDISRGKMGLCNDKRFSSGRTHNNYKCIET